MSMVFLWAYLASSKWSYASSPDLIPSQAPSGWSTRIPGSRPGMRRLGKKQDHLQRCFHHR